jgi:hypothetical protein
MRTAGSIPVNERTSEGTAMNASLKRSHVLTFAVILGLLFFPAVGGSDGLLPEGKGYSTVTFYVA